MLEFICPFGLGIETALFDWNSVTDPSDFHNVMSAFNTKGGISSQDSTRKIQVHQRYVLARAN